MFEIHTKASEARHLPSAAAMVIKPTSDNLVRTRWPLKVSRWRQGQEIASSDTATGECEQFPREMTMHGDTTDAQDRCVVAAEASLWVPRVPRDASGITPAPIRPLKRVVTNVTAPILILTVLPFGYFTSLTSPCWSLLCGTFYAYPLHAVCLFVFKSRYYFWDMTSKYDFNRFCTSCTSNHLESTNSAVT